MLAKPFEFALHTTGQAGHHWIDLVLTGAAIGFGLVVDWLARRV